MEELWIIKQQQQAMTPESRRKRPLVRSLAGILAFLGMWAAWQGPMDDSKLALLINWTELIGAGALAFSALGFRVLRGRP